MLRIHNIQGKEESREITVFTQMLSNFMSMEISAESQEKKNEIITSLLAHSPFLEKAITWGWW